jgi:hypothetical protein
VLGKHAAGDGDESDAKDAHFAASWLELMTVHDGQSAMKRR